MLCYYIAYQNALLIYHVLRRHFQQQVDKHVNFRFKPRVLIIIAS